MRGIRADRSNRYTPVPQTLSDEDEGVYDESPENSQHLETLMSSDCREMDVTEQEECVHPQPQDLDLRNSVPHCLSHVLPITLSKSTVQHMHTNMSCARQFCFVFAIGICLAYIVVILWLIPCQVAPCTPKSNRRPSGYHSKGWNVTLPMMHFVTKPQSVTVGPYGETLILLAFRVIDVAARDEVIGRKKNESAVGGVLALRAHDGVESWRHVFYTEVVDVLCDVTDVNNDGVPECAIIGSTGLLSAINASDGHVFWYLHDHEDQTVRVNVVSTPCALPGVDLDKDGVNDLAAVGLISQTLESETSKAKHLGGRPKWNRDEQIGHLLLISGSTGQIIGQPLALPVLYIPKASVVSSYLSYPLFYNWRNGSTALLLLSKSDDNMDYPDTILLVSLVDLYTEATSEWNDNPSSYFIGDGAISFSADLKEIFSGSTAIHSVQVVRNQGGGPNDILIVLRNNKLIYLGGENFEEKWSYRREGYVASHPGFGSFNGDAHLDVFLSFTAANCSSIDCRSKIVVLGAQHGQELMNFNTSCYAFDPVVLHSYMEKVPDIFTFKVVANENVLKYPISENQIAVGQKMMVSNGTDAFVGHGAASNGTKLTHDGHGQLQTNHLHKKLDPEYLYPLNRHQMDNSSIVTVDMYKYHNTSQQNASGQYVVELLAFQKDKGYSAIEMNVNRIMPCPGSPETSKNSVRDTVIQGKGISTPCMISITENGQASTIAFWNLSLRIPQNVSRTKVATLLHPTID